ncbi:hypothetical protein VCR15J2_470517 [Vibrio coralliirubri]|uniref:helix-turn-helix domain-containing protein n=1 Tax=Vibrio coralliirubri TaxID=1516159 RepID=UPI00063327F8|nr:helix-turn-helix domain-containing protein [Vibrio coralliirubri]CDT67755.1 hypothetical protein VCR15J2_470517 [Vibrio coralliirubri]
MRVYTIMNGEVTIEVHRSPDYIYSTSHSIPIRLTVIEFELLTLVLQEKKIKRSRCEELLWQGRVVSDPSRSLTQAVSTLRSKLSHRGAEKLLITVPRYGYQLGGNWEVVNFADAMVGGMSEPQPLSAEIAVSDAHINDKLGPQLFVEEVKEVKEVKAEKNATSFSFFYSHRSSLLLLLVSTAVCLLQIVWLYHKSIQGQYKYEPQNEGNVSVPKLYNLVNEVNLLGSKDHFQVLPESISIDENQIYILCRKDGIRASYRIRDYRLHEFLSELNNYRELYEYCYGH